MNTVTKKSVIVKNDIYKDNNQVVEVRIRQFYSIKPRIKVLVLLNDNEKIDLKKKKGNWYYVMPNGKEVVVKKEQ